MKIEDWANQLAAVRDEIKLQRITAKRLKADKSARCLKRAIRHLDKEIEQRKEQARYIL
jgi:hypothetical protein